MKKVIAILLLSLILLCACGDSGGQSDDGGHEPEAEMTYQDYYNLGAACMAEERYEEAVEAFTEAIAMDPEQDDAFVDRAEAYMRCGDKEGNLAAALADYEEALALNMRNRDAYLGIAQVHICEGAYDKALEILEQGIEELGEKKRIREKIDEINRGQVTDFYGNVHTFSPDTPEPSEDPMLAGYIGKTVGDVKRDFGGGYIEDYESGSSYIFYEEAGAFMIGDYMDPLTDDAVIRILWTGTSQPVVYGLTGAMTYPELVEAVGGEVSLDAPEYSYNEMDGVWQYDLSLLYRGYELYYLWEDDPTVSRSQSVHVTKSAEADPLMPAEPSYGSAQSGSAGQNAGGQWFQSVQGSKFFVPERFYQVSGEDLVQGMGMYHYIFQNDDLDMEISLFEAAFEALPTDASEMEEEFASAKAEESVTYSASGKSYYVVSGYRGNDMIYYDRADWSDTVYYYVEFLYPEAYREPCGDILTAFLRNYTVSK